ncbi:MAG: hypothetical protein KJ799_05055 [Bacteroidetes bacterium]|nr:hypothetical protein [Bacteroidota bacterium]MBU1678350.1 hypothetical protein [Bacteroidota bacterium]MBU2506075.1 hypothetical protein [Bacteroidota bacterium]
MAKKKTFWLSYDLGLKGDYSSLYRWLDKQKAKECGDSIAVFNFICSTANPREEIKDSLLESVEFNKTDRVYLIWREDTKQTTHGIFLIGHRKPAPWEGYFTTDADQTFDF